MPLRGYIDGVIGGELVGWALDEDALGDRLRVRGEFDGVVVGTAEASEPRRDLVIAGFGDGAYGFRIALDPGLLTPGAHAVAAVAAAGALPLAHDWIVRDEEDRPIEAVLLTPGEPAGDGSGRAASAGLDEELAASGSQSADALALALAATDPGALVAGVAGWTFVIRHARAGTHAELDAEAAAVEELFEIARSLGITASAVAVPAKHLIYAEHLPPDLRTDPERRVARALAARLRDSDDASLLDLYDALQDARAHGRVYPRTGSTLTWTGAIHAARAIVKSVAGSVPGLHPHPVAAYGFGSLQPVTSALEREDTEPALSERPSPAAASSLTGLIIHDGSAGRVAELLEAHVRRCRVVVAARVDPELVLSSGADAVIWIREDR